MEVDLSQLDTKNEEAIREAIRMEGVNMLALLQKQVAERKSAESQLLTIIAHVRKHWRKTKQGDDFGFQNDVASYLVGIDGSVIRQELSQGVKRALLAASIDKKNPVVMAAESIIWDIDDELARRESAKRAVQRALEFAKESKHESARQVLKQTHQVALEHGILHSTPLLKEAQEFSGEMLQDQQKKREKEQELRSAIEDAKNALDDSKRRFLLVLLFGGIVIAAGSAWAALAMTQPFALL